MLRRPALALVPRQAALSSFGRGQGSVVLLPTTPLLRHRDATNSASNMCIACPVRHFHSSPLSLGVKNSERKSSYAPQANKKGQEEKSTAQKKRKDDTAKKSSPKHATTVVASTGKQKNKQNKKERKAVSKKRVCVLTTAKTTKPTPTPTTNEGGSDFETALREQLNKSVAASLEVPLRKAVANSTLKQTLRQQELARRREWRAKVESKKVREELLLQQKKVSRNYDNNNDSGSGNNNKNDGNDKNTNTPIADDASTNPSKRLQRNYYYRKARDFDAAVRAARLKMEAKLATATANTSETAKLESSIVDEAHSSVLPTTKNDENAKPSTSSTPSTEPKS